MVNVKRSNCIEIVERIYRRLVKLIDHGCPVDHGLLPQGTHREPTGLTTGLCINDGNNQTNVEEFKAMMIGNVNVKISQKTRTLQTMLHKISAKSLNDFGKTAGKDLWA